MNEHCWHSNGWGESTAMVRNNQHKTQVRCCHCGVWATQKSHDEDYSHEDHGKFYNVQRRVIDSFLADGKEVGPCLAPREAS